MALILFQGSESGTRIGEQGTKRERTCLFCSELGPNGDYLSFMVIVYNKNTKSQLSWVSASRDKYGSHPQLDAYLC